MWAEPDAATELGWSPARTQLLRLHYALGLSAAVSAQLIGQVSRNAVISKRRRLGLMGANPLQTMRAFHVVGRTACPSPPGHFSWPQDDVADHRRQPLPLMELPVPPDAEPKTLRDRRRGECAWPLGPAEATGDYRTLFCCAPVEAGRGYCPVHRARSLSGEVLPPLRMRPARGTR
jgi:hypothetical protein